MIHSQDQAATLAYELLARITRHSAHYLDYPHALDFNAVLPKNVIGVAKLRRDSDRKSGPRLLEIASRWARYALSNSPLVAE